MLAFHVHVVNRHENRQASSGEEQIPEVKGEVVDQHCTHKGHHAGLVSALERHLNLLVECVDCKKHAPEGQGGIGPLQFFRENKVNQQNSKRKNGQQKHGQSCLIVRALEHLCNRWH